MLINMLEAVSEMLTPKCNDEPVAEFKVRVECARTLLNQIVNGMDNVPEKAPAQAEAEVEVEVSSRPPKRKPKENEIQIEVDASRKITKIINAKPETRLILDGIEHTAEEAIGKKFIEGKIK